MPYQLESTIWRKMFDVSTRSGEEIIDADDFRTAGQEPFAERRSDKAGTPCNETTLRRCVASHLAITGDMFIEIFLRGFIRRFVAILLIPFRADQCLFTG